MSSPLKLGIVLASIRQGRRGENYAAWFQALAAQRADVSIELLDLRDYPLHGYEAKEMPPMIETSYTDDVARRWSEKIHAQDGYVIVTPEYNHGYPGHLKNALDHVMKGFWYKPIGFVSYGGTAGGARAVEQLRSVSCELRMVAVRNEVNIRLIGLAADEKGHPTDPIYAKLAGGMLDQIIWWARLVKEGREKTPPPQ